MGGGISLGYAVLVTKAAGYEAETVGMGRVVENPWSPSDPLNKMGPSYPWMRETSPHISLVVMLWLNSNHEAGPRAR